MKRLRTVSVYCVMNLGGVLVGAVWYRVLIEPFRPFPTFSHQFRLDTGPSLPSQLNSSIQGNPLVALVDGQGVEGILLLQLGLDELDEGHKVRRVLLRLGPLLLRQQLVGDATLDGAADAEDAVVAFLFAETLKGGLDLGALFGDEIIGTENESNDSAGDAAQIWTGAHINWAHGSEQHTGDRAVGSQKHWRTSWREA